jgi:hypothetical protein
MPIINGQFVKATSDEVSNESGVSGATVTNALDTLDSGLVTTATPTFALQLLTADRNSRNLDIAMAGAFTQILSGGAVSSGSPQAVTAGITKLFVVINAGVDVDGTLTVTGDTVDRNTGAVTASDTDVITIDALTTDGSDTDAEGNIRHLFTGGYITSKWFSGSVSLSSADLDISDLDVWGVAFEQFNDKASTVIRTLDATFQVSNTAAWFYSYLYKVAPVVATKKCDITRELSLALDVGDSEADKPYRLRRGSQTIAIDGTHEGIFGEGVFGPAAQNYFNNINIKLWYSQPFTLT